MKILKTVLILLVAGALIVSAGCARGQSAQTTTREEIATIGRGSVSIDITAVGNLALSQTQDLAFDIDGTVEEVLVEEAQLVSEGEVLARLDKTDWEEQVSALEDKIVSDQRAVATKERAVTAAERALSDLNMAVTGKELALQQQQLNLETAEYNLGQLAEVKKIQDQIDNAAFAVNFATNMMTGEISGGTNTNFIYWSQFKANAQTELAQLEKDKADLLAGKGINISATVTMAISSKQLAVEQAKLSVESARNAVDDAAIAVEDGQFAIDNANIALEDARKALQRAQDSLDELKQATTEIVAPFSGFITRVNVSGGDEVKKGTVAVTLADPNKFEADVMVSQMDIFQVRLDGIASIEADALPGAVLPARVTHISPTATVQQGVVNYKVKVEVQTFSANRTAQLPSNTADLPVLASGELPPRLQQAVDSGMMTKEQAQVLLSQIQSGDFPTPSGGQSGAFGSFGGSGNRSFGGFGGGQFGQTRQNAFTSQDVQLKEGLSVTVSINTDRRDNVILVPNSAITSHGGQTTVIVLSSDGTREERNIETGINDWQNTEVTSGLDEGDQVVIIRTITTGTSTSINNQQRAATGGNAVRIPGGAFGR